MTVTPTMAAYFNSVGYKPFREQWTYHNSDARFRFSACGRRFGKSTMAARDVIPRYLLKPDKRVWCVGPTYDLSEKEFRVIWNDLIIKKRFGRDKRVKKAYNKRSGDMFITLPWQTTVECRSAEHPDLLVGEALDHVIMCEAAKHKKETWDRFIRPSLADKRGSADFPSTPEGFNWFYESWQFGRDPDLPEYACVDEKTEILTQRGWLRYDQVREGDQTLSINPKTGLSAWDTIESVHQYSGQHDLTRMESNQFSALTTGNHRWLVNSRPTLDGRSGGWRWKTTDTLAYVDGVPGAAPCVDLPTTSKYSDEFVELVAWIWTEGSHLSDSAKSLSISQSHVVNPENVIRIRRTLEVLAPRPVRNQDGYWSERRDTTRSTRFALGAGLSSRFWSVFLRHKVVDPAFVLSLTEAQLRLFVDVSQLGDGCTKGANNSIGQKSLDQLQAVQMACCLLGIPTTVRHSGPDAWKLLLGKRQFIRPKQAQMSSLRITKELYEGTVWCVSTHNANWLARRSGSVYYTGNSWKFPSWYNTNVYPLGRDDPEIILLQKTMVKEWFEQEIGADFSSFVGKIFPDWDEFLHVRPHVFRPEWKNYITFDWGYTNPLAAVEFQVSPSDQIYIWRVYYKNYKTIPDVARELKAQEHPEGYHVDLCFGDPADPEAVEMMTRELVKDEPAESPYRGAPVWAPPGLKNDYTWRDGIDLMSEFMKNNREVGQDEWGTPEYEPAYFVDPRCREVIKEHSNYRSKAPVKGQNVPELGNKIEDHTIDAIRYALLCIFKIGCQYHLADVMAPVPLVSAGARKLERTAVTDSALVGLVSGGPDVYAGAAFSSSGGTFTQNMDF